MTSVQKTSLFGTYCYTYTSGLVLFISIRGRPLFASSTNFEFKVNYYNTCTTLSCVIGNFKLEIAVVSMSNIFIHYSMHGIVSLRMIINS